MEGGLRPRGEGAGGGGGPAGGAEGAGEVVDEDGSGGGIIGGASSDLLEGRWTNGGSEGERTPTGVWK